MYDIRGFVLWCAVVVDERGGGMMMMVAFRDGWVGGCKAYLNTVDGLWYKYFLWKWFGRLSSAALRTWGRKAYMGNSKSEMFLKDLSGGSLDWT